MLSVPDVFSESERRDHLALWSASGIEVRWIDGLGKLHSIEILNYLNLVHFGGIDVGEASEPFRVSSASLPNSITRVGIELFADLQIP